MTTSNLTCPDKKNNYLKIKNKTKTEQYKEKIKTIGGKGLGKKEPEHKF